MDRYGITLVSKNYFHYKEFKYSNLEDGVVQARRCEKPYSNKIQ